MKINFSNTACFGVAGNFTGHLEQAGEAKDFINLKTDEEKAPKALFPTYIPQSKNLSRICPEFLHVFPFSSERIELTKEAEKSDIEQNFQIEPECALLFKAEWQDDRIIELKPLAFGASNDCSIRREGAKKISLKKNWGSCSKGFSDNAIEISSFDQNSPINDYRIASFLIRDKIYAYGEDSPIRDYSYVYGKLIKWIIDKLNNQADEGPAEKIHDYLLEAGKPQELLISIGATRYTDFGKSNFLKSGDQAAVILYPESKYSNSQIREMLEKSDFSKKDISFLLQKII
ncbi:MAG: DUF5718 family protein [Treponemataceae bacterium]|nr:DUF5718 family protein [Treponemataceae bacterium]